MATVVVILALTMFLTPITFCPLFLFDGYILPQILVMSIGIIATLLVFVSQGVMAYSWVIIVAMGLLIFLIASMSWSTCPTSSQKEVPLVFGYLIAFILAFTLFTYFSLSIKVVFIAASVSTLLTSCYGYLQSKGVDPFFPERVKSKKDEFKDIPIEEVAEFYRNDKVVDIRAISSLGNTNFACGFFLTGLPFVLGLSILIHWSCIFLAIPVIIGIIVTKSRAGYISLFISIYCFLLLENKGGWILSYLSSATDLELLIIQLGLFSVVLFLFHRSYFTLVKIVRALSKHNPINDRLCIEDTHKDHPVAHLRYRFRYWKAALWLIKRKPIIGYGLRTYRKEVYKAQAELDKKDGGKFLGPNYQTPQPRECHNDLIENFVEGGLVGGMLFLIIIGSVFYHGLCYLDIATGSSSLLMMFMLTGVVGILVDSCFFFPLRLGPSSLYFWVLLASIEATYANATNTFTTVLFEIHPIFIILLALGFCFMLYECLVKQNIANYYFNRFNFSKNIEKKEIHLNNAVKWSPKDNIFHTHMLISYMSGFPQVAGREAQILYENYDGMVPAWSMCYNCGIAAMLNNNYLKAVELFGLALYYYPSFTPARDQIQKVWPLAPLPNRGVKMKVIDKNVLAFINQCKSSSNNPSLTQEQGKILELSVIASILDEKVRLNIPQGWPFDVDRGMFLAPNELTGDHEVTEVGHIKLMIVKRKGNK